MTQMLSSNQLVVSNWLFFTAFMVAAMAVIGAVTRLTESGLSMVEWRPLIGALPPMNETEWQRVFDLYRETPEYAHKNAGMTLAAFQNIFFWEWFHRLWGRMIGLVYALPLLFFWLRGMIPAGYKGYLLAGLIFGGAQGLMGWYMVQSGLVDRPDVSHYRLAAHLLLAFFIFGYVFWLALKMRDFSLKDMTFCQKRHGMSALALLIVTISWGAFVAGLDAGRIYNTWPLMGGGVLPPETFGGHSALFEEHAWVQFTHRWLAALTFVFVASFAWRIKSLWLTGAITLQFVLGIITLLSHLWIPAAALHQLGALFVIATMIRAVMHRHA